MINSLFFELDNDVLSWRNKVPSWVEVIATAAEKEGEKFCKKVYHKFGRQLSNLGLCEVLQGLFNEAQEQREIDYKQDGQVKSVREIAGLTSKDTTISVVTRLIDSCKMMIYFFICQCFAVSPRNIR